MERKKFLLLTDLDGTFEGSAKDFKPLANFITSFETKNNCEVIIHFVSGASKERIFNQIKFLEKNNKTIFNHIDPTLIDSNFENSSSPFVHQVQQYKAKKIEDFLRYHGKIKIAGLCYMGDNLLNMDKSAFQCIPFYKNSFPLGAYSIMPDCNSGANRKGVDFYSPKKNILGCIDCLNQMSKKIELSKGTGR